MMMIHRIRETLKILEKKIQESPMSRIRSLMPISHKWIPISMSSFLAQVQVISRKMDLNRNILAQVRYHPKISETTIEIYAKLAVA